MFGGCIGMKQARHWRTLTLLLASVGSALASAGTAGEVTVVATIKPLHALVAGVMEGVSTPILLIEGAGSPHGYAMRPSDARALGKADLIVWVGPQLEAFLTKPLRALAPEARRLTLAELPDLALLPVRVGPTWEESERLPSDDEADGHAGTRADEAHGAAEAHRNHDPARGEVDMHIWLDPHNARRIVRAMARALTALDPANADAYRRNADILDARLTALDDELGLEVAGVRSVAYVVFHDAYQYFEHRYSLSVVGAVTVSPDRPPGAGRVYELRRRLKQAQARCLFHEPEIQPRLIRTLVEGTGARVGVLDPLGAGLAPGADLYFTLMRGLARDLKRCLLPPGP